MGGADGRLDRGTGKAFRYDSRYTMAMVVCARCGTPFPASGRRVFCSNACRQASYRARCAVAAPQLRAAPSPAPVVYQCPSCEQRYLSPVRRCEECNLFCRRLGPGGYCPHCQELVAYTELEP